MLLFSFFFFIFGALFGSFANVLIYRIPRNMNFVSKRSHCTQCKKQVAWYDNVPILSYFYLFGKCRSCKGKISLKYPLVELFFAIASLLLMPSYLNLETTLFFLFYFFVLFVFVVHFFIDIEFQILPDGLNLLLLLLFFSVSVFKNGWHHWVLGGAIGIFFPALVTYLYYKLRGQIGLGGGDIKLYGALGIYLGPFGIIYNIFFSCFLGSIIGLLLILLKKAGRETPIAFGPFIIIVSFFQIFLEERFNQLLSFLF